MEYKLIFKNSRGNPKSKDLSNINVKKDQSNQKQNYTPCQKGADSNKKISCFLIDTPFIERMTHMPKRFTIAIRAEQLNLSDFMTKKQCKEGMT